MPKIIRPEQTGEDRTMKKLLYLFIGTLLLLGVSSCGGLVVDVNYDETLLYGRWQEGTVFERYDDSGWGATWDVADDVSEEEAQLFQWRIEGSKLIQEHIATFATVAKVYNLNTLTASRLTYSDDYGKMHYFTKVE